jgi:uncharacterized alpha-E superfamily protein
MLARVARNIYWLARYLERAENTARLINVHGHLLLDLPKDLQVGWEPLIAISGAQNLFADHYERADEFKVVNFLLADANNPGAIINSLASARENLRTTRDIIPREGWELVNELYLNTQRRLSLGVRKNARDELLRYIIHGIQQITGMLYGAMVRDSAYDFLRIGRYLERSDMTTRILDVRSENLLQVQDSGMESLTPFENIQWMSVLKSLTAYQMYRQHSGSQKVRGANVLKFLLQNETFPRSVYYGVAQVERCLKYLPGNGQVLTSLAILQRHIHDANVEVLAHQGLHEFIDELQISMGWVHTHIDNAYFSGKLG